MPAPAITHLEPTGIPRQCQYQEPGYPGTNATWQRRHVGDPAWAGFIRRMEAASPEFAAIWATQDVAQPAYYAKVFRHPLYPRLEMTSASFAVHTAPGTRMIVYTPDNEATRAAMERLVADPVRHHFPCWPSHQVRARDLVPA